MSSRYVKSTHANELRSRGATPCLAKGRGTDSSAVHVIGIFRSCRAGDQNTRKELVVCARYVAGGITVFNTTTL